MHGTFKMMKTFVAEKFLSNSEVYRMGQAMFSSRVWHKPKLVLCQEKSQKGNERRDEEGLGRYKWLAVFFHPACVLRGSPPEEDHKTPS